MPRVVTVGRLDFMSEGLLLLTNDGGLARRLELPANGWIRRYRARVHGTVDEARLAALAKGITIEGVRYGAIQARLDRQQRSNAWLDIALAEGKNREVRRVLAHLDLPVMRLIRVAFGPFHLGELERGAVDEVPPQALDNLLGVKRAAAQGGLGEAQAQRRTSGSGGTDAEDRRRQASRPRRSGARGQRHAADRQPRPRGAVQHPGACQLARGRHLAADRRARARRLRGLRRARAGGAVARRRARDLPRQRRHGDQA